MLSARESLLAGLQTQVTTEGVSHSLFDRTANLLALVLLARLQLTAYFLALVMLDIFYLFWRHHLQFEMLRIVKFIARDLPTVFAALADLLD